MTLLQKACRLCATVHVYQVTEDELQRWHDGAHVQNVWPHMSADGRELLISGICGSCFDQMFVLMRRIEIVEACDHGEYESHEYVVPCPKNVTDCDGHDEWCREPSHQPFTVWPPEAVEAAAERLFWLDNPKWLKRWGWTEVAGETKSVYITRAEAALAAALEAMKGTP